MSTDLDSIEKAFKKGTGRPTKFDQTIAREILILVEVGAYMETAAASVGISKDTLYNWMKKGARQKEGELREFSDALRKAAARAETRDIILIDKAAQHNWKAAAWRLERKYPKRWGRTDKLEHSGIDGDAIPVRTENAALVSIVKTLLEKPKDTTFE